MTTAPSAPGKLADFRTLGPWYLVEFMNSYAVTLLTAGAYSYATERVPGSASERLWLSALWGFAYIFIALGAGRLSEKIGPKKTVYLMVVATVFTALAGIAVLHTPQEYVLWMLAAAMLPFNITSSAIWPALESAITRTAGRTPLSARMAIYNLSWGGAGFAAFFTRGALAEYSWYTIFLVPAAASLLSAVVLTLWPIPDELIGTQHVPDEVGVEHELDDPVVMERAQRLLIMAWIGNALAYVAVNVLIPIMDRLSIEAGMQSLTWIAMITSIWGFMRFAGFAITWKWAGWHYKVRWLMGAQLALVMSFFVMLTVHDPVVFIAMQVVFGLSTALIYSCSLYYAMHVSSGHGGHAGIHEALIGLGIAVGPALGALVGTGVTDPRESIHRAAWAVTAVLVAGTIAMAVVAMRRKKAAT